MLTTPVISSTARANIRTAQLLHNQVMENGAGMPMDATLRSYYNEYCSRIWNLGIDSFPTSFNVMEAFFRYDATLGTFRMLPEKDHQFSGLDFLDFVTGPDVPAEPLLETFRMKEGEVYNYNRSDAPDDILFKTEEGEEFGFAGASMVRRGDEVSVLMLGGIKEDMATAGDQLEGLDQHRQKIRDITPAPNRVRQAEPLDGAPGLWKHVAMMRFNIKERTLQIRYIYKDIGDSYLGWMDDPDCQLDEKTLASNVENLDKRAVIFEIGKTCLLLPAYFWFKREKVTNRRQNTRLFGLGSHQRRKIGPFSGPESIFFRMVEAVVSINPGRATSGSYTAPAFQVEVNGFWRRLKPDQTGHDPEGNAVEGRTWVKAHSRWQDNPIAPKTIWVKKTQ